MRIVWEKNSRVLGFLSDSMIDKKDIIPRGRTGDFPVEAATVRMKNLSAEVPKIRVYFRGPWNNKSSPEYRWAPTMMVTSESWRGDWYYWTSGQLDSSITFQDIHNVMDKIKRMFTR